MRVSMNGDLDGFPCRWYSEIPIHRFVAKAKRGEYVDHINGDKMDARRSNLRVCTHAENLRNRGPSKNNTTGFKGVAFLKEKGYYVVNICKDRNKMRLGYFFDAEVGARVWDREAIKLHGEFAKLNFPDEDNSRYVPPTAKCVPERPKNATGFKGVYPDGKGTYYVQVYNPATKKSTTIANSVASPLEGHKLREQFLKG